MSAELRVTAYGARLAVTVDDPSLIGVVQLGLPPRWTPLSDGPVDTCVSLSALLAAAPTLDDALAALQSRLHEAVARRARGVVFVHAGVVTYRERAILVPGRSMSGKTSLVAALLRAGATYFSDEYAVLDETGLVHPYPKALSIRQPGGRSLHIDPHAVGSPVGVTGCPIGLVVITTYNAGGTWHPTRVPRAGLALELLNHTVAVRDQPARALATVHAAIHADTIGVRSQRADADAIAPRLIAMVHDSNA